MGQWRIGERALRGCGAADKLGRCGEQPVALGADLGQSDLLVASDHKTLARSNKSEPPAAGKTSPRLAPRAALLLIRSHLDEVNPAVAL